MLRETPHMPTFGSVAAGHAITAVPIAVLLVIALWLAQLTPALANAGFLPLAGIGVVSTVLMTAIQLIIFRAVSWAKQHHQPGSPVLVLGQILTPPLSTGAVSWLFLGSTSASLMAAAAALITVVPALLYLDQPWKTKLSRKEIHQKLKENRQLVQEVTRGDHDPEWLKDLDQQIKHRQRPPH